MKIEYVETTQDNLSNVSIQAGQVVLTSDTHRQYLDFTGERKNLAFKDEVDINTAAIEAIKETTTQNGAHNYDNAVSTKQRGSSSTDTSTGYRIQSVSSIAYSNYLRWYKLPKNTDFILSSNITITLGKAGFSIHGNNSTEESGTTRITEASYDTNGKKEISFNTGNYEYIGIFIFSTWNTAAMGDVAYNDFLIRLASDPSDVYTPPAMTNRELTERVSGFTHGDVIDTNLNNYMIANVWFGYVSSTSKIVLSLPLTLARDVTISNISISIASDISVATPSGAVWCNNCTVGEKYLSVGGLTIGITCDANLALTPTTPIIAGIHRCVITIS